MKPTNVMAVLLCWDLKYIGENLALFAIQQDQLRFANLYAN